jgi:CBS domain-containing protein
MASDTSRSLSTFRFPNGTCIAQAQAVGQMSVTLASPATAVMTDLTQVRAATVHPDTGLAQAEATMIQQGVRMLFVVSHMPCVDGIVTAADVLGDKPAQRMQARQLRRHELCVADVMTPLAELDVVDLQALRGATVGDALGTLARFGRPHLLVVEAATPQEPARIRGVVSHTQIERQLGQAAPIHAVAQTFAEVEQALA